ncbi:MAG: PilC/PilY family type IV pilus protein, partial [Nitrospinota bacterium]
MTNYKNIFRGVCFLIMIACSSALAQTNSDYTAAPPFIAGAIEPNVLIVLDNSGSMCDQAYAGSYDPSGFTNGQYYGYFDGSKNYKYTNNGRWEETSEPLTNGTPANPIASGSFLSWATMRRVEVAKKLLIGGKADPRSPNAGITVKLTAETDCSSSWDFQKDYDTTGQNLISFNGNYRFTRSSNELSVSPISGADTFLTYPNADVSIPAGWTVFPAASNAWADVDEASSDGDVTYIQNNNTTSPVLLDYNYTQLKPAGTITVTVKVRAKKTASGSTRSIQGVLRIGGVNYESNTSSLSTSYSLYSFTWTTNPATGAAWDWNDIKSAGIGSLQSFGVQAAANYAASPFPRVTQVYLDVSVTIPSGGPYNTIVDQGMTKAEGIIDRLTDKARFGLAYYNRGDGLESGSTNGRYDGGNVNTYIDFGSTTSMITSIHNMAPSTWTPLGETFYEMVRYFRQDSPYYTGNSPADYQTGLNYDPYYFNYPGSSSDQYVPCAKSFILLLTDGESTQDRNIPDSLKGYSISDYLFAGTTVGTTYSSNGRDYLIDVALWARTNDMRPGSCTTTPTSFQQCIKGNQNVILYPVFMFGTGSTLLKDAAINGGFNDLNGNNLPDCSTIPEECYRDTNGDGIIDSNDLPLTYFEGDDGYALETNITNAITDMLKRSASGTSVSVLTTSASGAGDIFQCYFLPSKTVNNREITWLGHLLQLGISAKGEILDNANNKITFSFNDTEGQTYVNNVTAGSSDPLTEWTGYKWDAGENLVTKTHTSRTIKTFVDMNKNGVIDSGEYIPFEDTNKATLRPYLRASTDTESENIINYIRGASISGYRDRTYSGTDQYKLGDIIYSTPTVASVPAENYGLIYGDKTYSQFFDSWKSRDTIVFIGSNEGMLHAFKSSDGSELWAFIPQNLLPHLKWLTDTNYSHVYYVDLRAKVTDINFGDTASPNWKTILIGGMRLGGGQISVTDDFGTGSETRNFQSSYFAIDITDPASPNLLWEFTDSNLGFTASYPAIAKVGNEWFVIIGSGSKSSYVPDYTGASTQTGKIFVLNARNTGAWTLNSTYWKFDTGINNGFMGDPLSVDIDFKTDNIASDGTTSYNTEVVYIGESYDSGGTPKWRGKLFRLVLKGEVNPSNWSLSTLFDGNAFSTATPITISPVATVDELNNLWVYFGTGRFYSQPDKLTTTKHNFFGIKDSYWDGSTWKPCWDGSTWSSQSQCTTSGITSTSSLFNAGEVTQVVEGGGSVSTTTWGNIDWETFVTNVSSSSTYRGWYTELAQGTTDVGAERVITKPSVIGGILLFTTFIPKTDVCSYGGESNLY